MRLASAAVIVVLLFSSCVKDVVKQAEQNYVLGIMTNGKWKVTSFVEGSTDVTSSFAPYSFQFKNDLTVDAYNNGSVEKSGTWNADPNALTITSNFPNASATLTLLNGTWRLTDTYTTYVKAIQQVGGVTWTLRLDKL